MSRFLSVYLLICLYDVNYTIKILFQSWYYLSLGVSICSWLTFQLGYWTLHVSSA